jgi:hypothetical protein
MGKCAMYSYNLFMESDERDLITILAGKVILLP